MMDVRERGEWPRKDGTPGPRFRRPRWGSTERLGFESASSRFAHPPPAANVSVAALRVVFKASMSTWL